MADLTKTCRDCGIEQPIGNFYTNKGLAQNSCKSCVKLSRKNEYAKDKDKIKEKNKRSYLKHRGKRLLSMCDYRKANTDKISQAKKDWWKLNRAKKLAERKAKWHENREKNLLIAKEWRGKNKEWIRNYNKQYNDVVIIDTAGRLHNKVNLMNELTKVKRVMQKVVEEAPHDVLLVLDGSTGQNAFEQAKQFTAATEVSCLAVTKLDGTAKGGVVIGISDQFQIPVKYIGVGEGIEDLQVFNKYEFVDSFFK